VTKVFTCCECAALLPVEFVGKYYEDGPACVVCTYDVGPNRAERRHNVEAHRVGDLIRRQRALQKGGRYEPRS
jgi:hypothetical protein